MKVQGKYRLKGSAYPGLKVLVSGRELNELGQPKYPKPPYTSDAGLNYYLAIPGRRLDKIDLIEYDPSDPGQETYGFISSFRFTSLSPHPKDWELDMAIPKWNAFIDDSVDPPYTYFENLAGYIYCHNTGRKEGDFGEFKAIDDAFVINPYYWMQPIGKGQFIGEGLVFTVGATNPDPTYTPLHFWSPATGLITSPYYSTQSIVGSPATGYTHNGTQGFTFNNWITGGVIFSNDYFEGTQGTPKEHWLSNGVTIVGENYNLSASSVLSGATFNFTCSANYDCYDTITGVRNSTHAFVFKDSLTSFTASGSFPEFVGGVPGWNTANYDYNRTAVIYKANLETGILEEVCSYTTTVNHGASMAFDSGRAYTPVNGSTVATGINVAILPLFLEAIRNPNFTTWAGDILYYIKDLIIGEDETIFSQNYTATLIRFDLNDLTSYQQQTIEIEKSEQPETPILLDAIVAMQYLTW